MDARRRFVASQRLLRPDSPSSLGPSLRGEQLRTDERLHGLAESRQIDCGGAADKMHPATARLPGAIGFDWFSAGEGGVSWLISWPRKKLIKQQLPLRSSA